MKNSIEMQSVSVALARSALYKVLAKSFLSPAVEVYMYIGSQDYANTLLQALSINAFSHEMKQDIRSLINCLAARSVEHDREVLEVEYNRLFAHLGSAKSPPYETEYGYENIFQKTEAMADISGFYRAYGLEVSSANSERVDFISTEFEFMSYLTLKEAYALECANTEHLEICVDTQRKFIKDHLGRWTALFAAILARSTENEFYLRLGRLANDFIENEARSLNVMVEQVSAPIRVIDDIPLPFGCDGCIPSSLPGGARNEQNNENAVSSPEE